MQRDLDALASGTFDLVVIGGGIQGAATAREAALRGWKVALVEARDFASGTSGRSSKLIHGGLRYLEQFDFKLVHESRTERRLLLRLAPHLARPLPFVLPIYAGDPYFPLKIRLGLTIYDLLGNLGRDDRHRMLNPDEALRMIPALRAEGLRAAAIYHDSQTDDARLTIENVLGAAEQGAVVANYTEIRGLAGSARGRAWEVVSAEAEDRLTGRRYEISARFWVNATGPWVDHVRALLFRFDGSKTTRLTKGAHLILPPVSLRYAIFAAIIPGERVFLMMPWYGQALLGTTDTDFEGDPGGVRPDRSDVDYLLQAVNRVLDPPLKAHDVLGGFAGLRALALEPGQSPSENTREYRFHEEAGTANFISICGGKLTTARALGERLVDLIASRLGGRSARALTSRTVPLPGGQTGPFEAFVRTATEQGVREFRLPPAVAERLARTYGSRWRRVLEPMREAKHLAELLPGTPTLLAAEVDFAIREEMALTVEDFLVRRSGLNWLAACSLGEAAPAVAQVFARHFDWGPERHRAALEALAHLTSFPAD
jgi:glycerol-3-phosphate dehydrogenase